MKFIFFFLQLTFANHLDNQYYAYIQYSYKYGIHSDGRQTNYSFDNGITKYTDYHYYYNFGYAYEETEFLKGHYFALGYDGYKAIIQEYRIIVPKNTSDKYKSYYEALPGRQEYYKEDPSGFTTSYTAAYNTYLVNNKPSTEKTRDFYKSSLY